MIEIKFKKNNGILRVTAEGHAFDETGKSDPIVCAGASALAFTLGQCLLSMYADGQLKKKPEVDIKDGFAYIEAQTNEESDAETQLVFWVYLTGIALMEHNYKGMIRLYTDIKPEG